MIPGDLSPLSRLTLYSSLLQILDNTLCCLIADKSSVGTGTDEN